MKKNRMGPGDQARPVGSPSFAKAVHRIWRMSVRECARASRVMRKRRSGQHDWAIASVKWRNPTW